jgi:hypothetical protein
MTKLYGHLAVTAILAFGGLAAVLMGARFGARIDVMTVIFFAGSTGAVVNNYFRLAKISTNPSALGPALDNKVVIIQFYVSLLIAGILGFVMYGLCVSGLLQGALFPKFTQTGAAYTSVTSFLDTLAPETNLDTAKALIWAFIAGFSERLIPNILDRLVAQAERTRGSDTDG